MIDSKRPLALDSNPTLDLKSIENLPKSGAQISFSSPKMRIIEENNSKSKSTKVSEYYSKDALKTEESESPETKDHNGQSEARTTVTGSYRKSSTFLNELKWENVVIVLLIFIMNTKRKLQSILSMYYKISLHFFLLMKKKKL